MRPPRPPRRLAPLLAATLCGCANLEGPSSRGSPDAGVARRAGTPSWAWTTLGESVDRPVADPDAARRAQWIVEAGLVGSALGDAGTTLPDGLAAAVRSDTAATGVETVSVEEGTPTTVFVGDVRWPAGSADAAGAACAGDDVRVEWQVCLRVHGSCAADVDAVPRLVGPRGVVVLERYRVRRTVPVDSALVVGTAAGRAASPSAAALVGGRDGRPSRLVLRVKP